MNFPVNPQKATEAYCRLLEQEGGRADHLRLAKLIYVADRKSLIERGIPIVGGTYYSMAKGPMISETTNFALRQNAPGWKEHISVRYGNEIKLLKPTKISSLSDSEIQILDSVVEDHRERTTEELVEWCHKNCPEYKEVAPHKRLPISVEKLLAAGKKSERQIAAVVNRASADLELTSLLAKL